MLPQFLAQLEPKIKDAETSAIGYGFTKPKGSNIGAIISDLLKYIFPLSGLLLLFFLISGGFDLMTAAGDPKKTEQAKEKITAAIVGFIIVFVAFWIWQLVRYILGIDIV